MNRGDVVEVIWPYSDLMGAKVRPAVVVRSDFLAGLIDDIVLVKITGSHFGVPGTEVRLVPRRRDGRRTQRGLQRLLLRHPDA